MNYLRDNSEDPFKKLRAMMERFGYCSMSPNDTFPVEYRKGGFAVCLFNFLSTPTVSLGYIENEKRTVHIGTTGTIELFQFKNIPMAIMKKAIRHPENAYNIFNKYDIERALKKL